MGSVPPVEKGRKRSPLICGYPAKFSTGNALTMDKERFVFSYMTTDDNGGSYVKAAATVGVGDNREVMLISVGSIVMVGMADGGPGGT